MRDKLAQVITALGTGVLLLATAPTASATVYVVSFNGAVIDLTGSITTESVGSFSPSGFNSIVIDYSITASVNGSTPFTWNRANSTWLSDSQLDTAVTINVTPSTIELSAPTGSTDFATNVFLYANDITNFAQENLRLFQDLLGYRAPHPNFVYFDRVPVPFVLAQVPEPAPVGLLVLGMITCFAMVRYRKSVLATTRSLGDA